MVVVVVVPADGKGVVMRPEGLRAATAAKAAHGSCRSEPKRRVVDRDCAQLPARHELNVKNVLSVELDTDDLSLWVLFTKTDRDFVHLIDDSRQVARAGPLRTLPLGAQPGDMDTPADKIRRSPRSRWWP